MNKQVEIKTIEAGQGLHVAVFGGVPFVFPAAARLDADQQADVGRAQELADLGATAAAAAILGHLERALGVTPEEHIVGVLAGEAALAAERRKAQVALAARRLQHVKRLNEAVVLPALNAATQLSLDQADAARERADACRAVRTKTNRVADPGALKAALADVRRHHDRAARLRREQLDAWWIAAAESETERQARVRGEETGYVQVLDAAVLRISTHDGLATLFDAGSITSLQWRAGRAYRALFELPNASIKVATFQAGPGGGYKAGGKFNPKRPPRELQRAMAIARLDAIERAICPLVAQPNRELVVLRAVAGEGRTLRSLTSGGRGYQANSAALQRALDVAAAVLWTGACESGSV